MTNIDKLLNTTSAGQLAQKLDAMDGKKDGKISASVWNSFVKGKGGKEIKNYIETGNAMNSVMTYGMKNAKKSGSNVNDLMKDWGQGLENVQTTEQNKPAENNTGRSLFAEPVKDPIGTEYRAKLTPEDEASIWASMDEMNKLYDEDKYSMLDAKIRDCIKDGELLSLRYARIMCELLDKKIGYYDNVEHGGKPVFPKEIEDYYLNLINKEKSPTDLSEILKNQLDAFNKIQGNEITNKQLSQANILSDSVIKPQKNIPAAPLLFDNSKAGKEIELKDESGRRIQSAYYNFDGELEEYVNIEYDKQGNESKNIWHNPDGSVNFYEEYEYDNDGNLTKTTTYNPDGSIRE